jgi:hypothetical protein
MQVIEQGAAPDGRAGGTASPLGACRRQLVGRRSASQIQHDSLGLDVPDPVPDAQRLSGLRLTGGLRAVQHDNDPIRPTIDHTSLRLRAPVRLSRATCVRSTGRADRKSE